MEDDQGGSNIRYISDGGLVLQDRFGGGFPGVASEVVGNQAAGVAFAEEGIQVVDAALSAGGFEGVVVADDPGGEVTGIGAPGDDEASGIGPTFRHGLVERGEDIAGRTC